MGRVPPARGARPDDVRADDRGLVDLHRHAGHRAGHLRVLRRDRAPPLRRLAGGHDHADRRARRHGRRAAAGGDDERRASRCASRSTRTASSGGWRRATSTSRPTTSTTRSRAAWRRRRDGRALSVGLLGNAADVLPRLLERRLRGRHRHRPDERARPARRLRPGPADARGGRRGCARDDPDEYVAPLARRDGRALRGDGRLQGRAAPRSSTTATTCARRRSSAASSARSTIPASCPRTCGRCSARGRVRSAGSRCRATRPTSPPPTGASLEVFPDDDRLARWIQLAQRADRVPGPAGAHLLARLRRAARGSGCASTRWCASGELSAPIVIGRDHLDSGSVASPYRETEGMADGSDAIADWPLLNALVNTASGASWVSIHHGGGVGIGRSHPRGHGRRRRRHGPRGARSSNACSPPIRAWA